MNVYLTGDTSTEQWLDEIERRLHYARWYAGHFHTTKTVGKLRLIYQDYARLGKWGMNRLVSCKFNIDTACVEL